MNDEPLEDSAYLHNTIPTDFDEHEPVEYLLHAVRKVSEDGRAVRLDLIDDNVVWFRRSKLFAILTDKSKNQLTICFNDGGAAKAQAVGELTLEQLAKKLASMI
jgi:hypothetical protein